jgi:F0F1-type ATP synthase assembly protein I
MTGQNDRAARAQGLSGAAYAGLGLQFALSILVFLFLGNWLDRKLGTRFLGILLMFVGAAGGFYSIYRKLMAAQRAEAQRKAEQKAEKKAEQERRARP